MVGLPAQLDPTKGPLVLGVDGAWGGLGWCVADAAGPKAVGWSKAPRPDHSRLIWLHDLFDLMAADVEAADEDRPHGAPRPRLAVERPPQAHSRGGQATTAYALGCVVGPLLTWGARPGCDWLPPWQVPTSHEVSRRGANKGRVLRYGWRPWWGLAKVGPAPRGMTTEQGRAWKRERRKRFAVAIAYPMAPWAFPDQTLHQASAEWDGRAGDVAEAILIAVGCARNEQHAPRLVW